MLYIPYPFKRCTKCGNEYPRTPKHFGIDRRKRDGLQSCCRGCGNIVVAKWRREHPEHTAEWRRQYRATHSKQIAEWKREHYAKHTDQYKAYTKRWEKANPERARKSGKERGLRYYYAHQDREKARRHRRRAAGKVDEATIKAQYKRQRGRCYYCNAKVGKDYHLDHVVPVARGGTSDPDNLVIACPSCNLSKNDRLPHEWAKGGRLL